MYYHLKRVDLFFKKKNKQTKLLIYLEKNEFGAWFKMMHQTYIYDMITIKRMSYKV